MSKLLEQVVAEGVLRSHVHVPVDFLLADEVRAANVQNLVISHAIVRVVLRYSRPDIHDDSIWS